MNVIKTTALSSALIALAIVASGCCGGACDAAQSPQARQQFISDYNVKNTGCNIEGEGDLLQMTMTCDAKAIDQVKREAEAGCIGFKIVGVESVTIKGKDGSAECAMSDCKCK